MKLEEIERRYEKWQCCCGSIGGEMPPFNPHLLMKDLIAVAKASKRYLLDKDYPGSAIMEALIELESGDKKSFKVDKDFVDVVKDIVIKELGKG